MLTPTKVTVNIREATTPLFTNVGPFWSGNPSGVLEFEGDNRTLAVTKAVVFIETITCPSEPFEWALINWAMRNWLWHKADPSDPFKNQFSYASGKLWMITLTIEEIKPCQSQQPTPPQPESLPLTNTKSLLAFFRTVWKRLFSNT